MLTITDGESLARALKLPIDHQLKRLLLERGDQLGGNITNIARFVVIQGGGSLNALETELGFSVFETAVDGRRFGDPEFSPSWDGSLITATASRWFSSSTTAALPMSF